jgi:hypothetical protein
MHLKKLQLLPPAPRAPPWNPREPQAAQPLCRHRSCSPFLGCNQLSSSWRPTATTPLRSHLVCGLTRPAISSSVWLSMILACVTHRRPTPTIYLPIRRPFLLTIFLDVECYPIYQLDFILEHKCLDIFIDGDFQNIMFLFLTYVVTFKRMLMTIKHCSNKISAYLSQQHVLKY